MRSETIDSFKWFFREFVNMMGVKAPQTILTDQARAMEVAIGEVLKETIHRWCKWHILCLAKENLGDAYSKNSDFKDAFHKILNDMLTIEEFEKAWKELMEKHGLQEHPFIEKIYAIKEMWAKPYFAGVFCAKQTSTQRSESANHMFKGYCLPGSPMHQFVTQYMKLVAERDEQTDYEERMNKLAKKSVTFNFGMERHAAAKVYTDKVMRIVEKEIFESGNSTRWRSKYQEWRTVLSTTRMKLEAIWHWYLIGRGSSRMNVNYKLTV
uniref:Protein FAR1-RELATED SEQUENCE n=1 Tax=Arundo donax TaxID=35708 RepID=A0A0A9FX48_ARUDO